MTKTFVIAEAGANHNRDWTIATNLIDVAVSAGADAVKFQTYSSETLYASNTPDFAGYKSINSLIKSIELPRQWQKDLKLYCDDAGIEFMSTPFDERAIDELVSLGVKRLKIAGFEATDPRFVDLVASTGLPIIMSAGIGFDRDNWTPYAYMFEYYENHLTLLHCNNAYPTPMEDANLSSMKLLSTLPEVDSVGYSDHTMNTLTPSLAVAMGAQVIEKHFTLDNRMEGPDHPFALEPNQLKSMIELIRLTELTLGTKSKYSKSEEAFSMAGRSVVSKVDLKPGDIITEDKVTTKRPLLEDSINARHYFQVLGMIVTQDIKADTPLPINSLMPGT